VTDIHAIEHYRDMIRLSVLATHSKTMPCRLETHRCTGETPVDALPHLAAHLRVYRSALHLPSKVAVLL
jgi:hypothetical protein